MTDTMSTEVDLRGLAIDRGGAAPSRLRTRRHLLTRYVLPVGLVAGFLSLTAWASWNYVFPPKDVTVVPVYATTSEVRREGAALFKAAGWIEPRPTPVRAAALAPGVVEKLLVVEDEPVRAGQPIAELVKDDAKLAHDGSLADLKLQQAELDVARAELKAAETRLKQPVHLEAALGESEALLAKMETQLQNLPFATRRAEADLDAARKDFEGKLAAKGAVSGIAVDEARSRKDSAAELVAELRRREASLKKERAALARRRDALKTQLELLADEIRMKETAEANVRSAQARVEQSRVAVAEAKLKHDRMTVRAPLDGRVYRLVGHPGAHVGGGRTHAPGYDSGTVVTLYRPDMLQVRVDVRFEDVPKVHLNQPVRIENPALPSPLTGTVLYISSEADIQKNTLQVKVAIPNPPSVFKPEMLVDVTFLEPRKPDRESTPSQEWKLYVPRELVHDGDGEPFVWLADQSQGTARRTPVQLGSEGSGDLVEVVAGLTASSRILSSGTDDLRDGDRIRITGEDPSFGVADNTRRGGASRALNRLPTGRRE